jgi:hypothetical protein
MGRFEIKAWGIFESGGAVNKKTLENSASGIALSQRIDGIRPSALKTAARA